MTVGRAASCANVTQPMSPVSTPLAARPLARAAKIMGGVAQSFVVGAMDGLPNEVAFGFARREFGGERTDLWGANTKSNPELARGALATTGRRCRRAGLRIADRVRHISADLSDWRCRGRPRRLLACRVARPRLRPGRCSSWSRVSPLSRLRPRGSIPATVRLSCLGSGASSVK